MRHKSQEWRCVAVKCRKGEHFANSPNALLSKLLAEAIVERREAFVPKGCGELHSHPNVISIRLRLARQKLLNDKYVGIVLTEVFRRYACRL